MHGKAPVPGGSGGQLLPLLLSAELALLAAYGGPGLPEAAIVTLINLDLSAQQIDGWHLASFRALSRGLRIVSCLRPLAIRFEILS